MSDPTSVYKLAKLILAAYEIWYIHTNKSRTPWNHIMVLELPDKEQRRQ